MGQSFLQQQHAAKPGNNIKAGTDKHSNNTESLPCRVHWLTRSHTQARLQMQREVTQNKTSAKMPGINLLKDARLRAQTGCTPGVINIMAISDKKVAKL